MIIKLFKDELPETLTWDSGYGGFWSSEFIYVLSPPRHIEVGRFSVTGGNKATPPTEETKRIMGRVNRDSVSNLSEHCAWMYAKDVHKLIAQAAPTHVWAATSKTMQVLFATEADARKMQPTATSPFDVQRVPVFGAQAAPTKE